MARKQPKLSIEIKGNCTVLVSGVSLLFPQRKKVDILVADAERLYVTVAGQRSQVLLLMDSVKSVFWLPALSKPDHINVSLMSNGSIACCFQVNAKADALELA